MVDQIAGDDDRIRPNRQGAQVIRDLGHRIQGVDVAEQPCRGLLGMQIGQVQYGEPPGGRAFAAQGRELGLRQAVAQQIAHGALRPLQLVADRRHHAHRAVQPHAKGVGMLGLAGRILVDLLQRAPADGVAQPAPGKRVVVDDPLLGRPRGEPGQRDDQPGSVLADAAVHQSRARRVGDGADGPREIRAAVPEHERVDAFQRAGARRSAFKAVYRDRHGRDAAEMPGMPLAGFAQVDDGGHSEPPQPCFVGVGQIVRRRGADQPRAAVIAPLHDPGVAAPLEPHLAAVRRGRRAGSRTAGSFTAIHDTCIHLFVPVAFHAWPRRPGTGPHAPTVRRRRPDRTCRGPHSGPPARRFWARCRSPRTGIPVRPSSRRPC